MTKSFATGSPSLIPKRRIYFRNHSSPEAEAPGCGIGPPWPGEEKGIKEWMKDFGVDRGVMFFGTCSSRPSNNETKFELNPAIWPDCSTDTFCQGSKRVLGSESGFGPKNQSYADA